MASIWLCHCGDETDIHKSQVQTWMTAHSNNKYTKIQRRKALTDFGVCVAVGNHPCLYLRFVYIKVIGREKHVPYLVLLCSHVHAVYDINSVVNVLNLQLELTEKTQNQQLQHQQKQTPRAIDAHSANWSYQPVYQCTV